ncbi:MAG: DUF6078 family protein [Prevotella sp.]|nr:DUF6078 family protein [Prevotella sp.]
MGKKQNTTKNREEVFKEKADKGYGICHSQTCEQRGHCLHALLCSYVPKDRYYTTCVNLNNPLMQTAHCPAYLSDQPVRMPLGISNIYYDMPARIASPLKQHLIAYFNRKRYYEYHFGRRPVSPAHEQYIRQAAIRYGWQHPIEFNGYVEDYLW